MRKETIAYLKHLSIKLIIPYKCQKFRKIMKLNTFTITYTLLNYITHNTLFTLTNFLYYLYTELSVINAKPKMLNHYQINFN